MFTDKRPRERGAVAVEAALVMPLLLLMVLGIVELSLLMRDDIALSSAVRTGGRIASTTPNLLAGQSTAAAEGGDCPVGCDPTNTPQLARAAADAVAKAGTALPREAIQELWVYRANADGFPMPTGNKTWTCTTDCVIYHWVATPSGGGPGQFRYYSGSWRVTNVYACAGGGKDSTGAMHTGPDAVGVYMLATHKTVTGFVIKNVNIEDHSVFQFEPLPSATCMPGTHP